MLHQERIPIGKLKQAFWLNAQDVQTLLSALPPDGVFPTDLWQKAYSSFWYGKICDYRELYKLDSLSFPAILGFLSFPEVKIFPERDYYIEKCRESMIVLFIEIASIFLSDKVKAGLDYVIDEAYETDDDIFAQERKNLFEKLAMEDKNFAVRFRACVNAKQFVETLDDKRRAVSYGYFSFLSKICYDAIVVDKITAIRHLLQCGYPLRQEVKGISKALVERITATLDVQPQEETPVPFNSSIVVPRALWEGKSYPHVRNDMRDAKYPPEVIAYALHEWCKLKNVTEIGRLLSPAGKTDSAYLRRGNQLLKKAAALNITTA